MKVNELWSTRHLVIAAILVACAGGCSATVSEPSDPRSETPAASDGRNASGASSSESAADLVASFRQTPRAARDAWLRDHMTALSALDAAGVAEVKNAVMQIVMAERSGLGTQAVTDEAAAEVSVEYAGSCSSIVCGGGVLGDLKCLFSSCFRGCSFASAVCYEN